MLPVSTTPEGTSHAASRDASSSKEQVMNILHIVSSARGDQSYSNRVAGNVLDELRRGNPGATVVTRDVARDVLPHIDEDFVTATRSPNGPQTEKQRGLLALSDRLVDELLAADLVVIATPMINF